MAGSVRAESSDRAPDVDSVGSCKAGSPAATTPGPWGLRGYQIRAEGGRGQHIATYMTTRGDGLLLASAPALVSALEKCIRDFENMDENQPTDAGCIDCTAGTVPNHLNTGRCGYHEAKVALRLARGEA